LSRERRALGAALLIGAAAWYMLAGDRPLDGRPGSPVPPGEGDDGYGTYWPLIYRAAQRHGVRPELVDSIIARESGYDPLARNPASSARGLMQVTRAAAQDVGADWHRLDDPALNIEAGTAYLAMMIRRFGEWDGVRAYHAGPGTILRGDNPALLAQADDYAEAVWV
jgi:soluble lytic murein transglycosylase-like protein